MQKSPTVEIIDIYSIGVIVPIDYMPIISAVGFFCFDKFEDNQTKKCSTFFPNVIVNFKLLNSGNTQYLPPETKSLLRNFLNQQLLKSKFL